MDQVSNQDWKALTLTRLRGEVACHELISTLSNPDS